MHAYCSEQDLIPQPLIFVPRYFTTTLVLFIYLCVITCEYEVKTFYLNRGNS
jgi:hypothetical protein